MVCRERLGSDTVVGFVVKEFHSLFLCHYIFNLIFSNCIKAGTVIMHNWMYLCDVYYTYMHVNNIVHSFNCLV